MRYIIAVNLFAESLAQATYKPISRFTMLAILLITALALILRLWNARETSLWIDDYYSIAFSTGHGMAFDRLPRGVLIESPPDYTSLQSAKPILNIWTSLDGEPNPPLYYFLLRIWREVLHYAHFDTDFSMRFLSIVLGVVAVPLAFDVCRSLSRDDTLSLFAASIVALAAPHISVSMDLRAYALLSTLLVLAAAAVLRLHNSGPTFPRLLTIALCVLGGMLSHYYAIGGCFAIGVFGIICLRPASRRLVLLALFLAGVIYSIIWLPFLFTQSLGIARHSYLFDVEPDPIWQTFRRLLLLPLRLLGEPTPGSFIPASLFALAVLVLPTLLMRTRRVVILPYLAVALPILVVLCRDLIDTTYQLYVLRFTAACVPMLAVLVALLVPGRARYLLPAAVVMYQLISLPTFLSTGRESFRALGDFYNTHQSQSQLVVYLHPKPGRDLPMLYHLTTYHHHGPAKLPVLLIEGTVTDEHRDIVSRFDTVLLVRAWDHPIQDAQLLPDYREVAARYESFGGVIRLMQQMPTIPVEAAPATKTTRPNFTK